jgi:hypothetical protein
MFKLTSFPINFVSSAFTLSTPAPPFPITIPGLAVYKFTFIAFAVLSISILEIPARYNFFFKNLRIFWSSTK